MMRFSTTLDRHLWHVGLRRWFGVLVIGCFLMVAGRMMAELGDFMPALASRRWWLAILQLLSQIPSAFATWLPLSVLVAAMLVAAPMSAGGTLTALAAGGVATSRVFRRFLLLALMAGAMSFLLGDQVVPRLVPVSDRLDAAMRGKGESSTDRIRPMGWRSDKTVWTVARAMPAVGRYDGVAAFRTDSPRMLAARRLEWTDGAWNLIDPVVVEGDRQQPWKAAAPAQLGFDLVLDDERLAESLRSDDSRTSDELFTNGAQRRWQILAYRVAVALLPLLCLLYALPAFVRWNDRTRLGFTAARTLLWTLPPLLAVGLLARLLVSAGAQPITLAIGIMGMMTVFGWLRWRRMRV